MLRESRENLRCHTPAELDSPGRGNWNSRFRQMTYSILDLINDQFDQGQPIIRLPSRIGPRVAPSGDD